VIAEAANPVNGLAGYRMEFRSTSGAGMTRHGFEVLSRLARARNMVAVSSFVTGPETIFRLTPEGWHRRNNLGQLHPPRISTVDG
jgi:hypothetical protein